MVDEPEPSQYVAVPDSALVMYSLTFVWLICPRFGGTAMLKLVPIVDGVSARARSTFRTSTTFGAFLIGRTTRRSVASNDQTTRGATLT